MIRKRKIKTPGTTSAKKQKLGNRTKPKKKSVPASKQVKEAAKKRDVFEPVLISPPMLYEEESEYEDVEEEQELDNFEFEPVDLSAELVSQFGDSLTQTVEDIEGDVTDIISSVLDGVVERTSKKVVQKRKVKGKWRKTTDIIIPESVQEHYSAILHSPPKVAMSRLPRMASSSLNIVGSVQATPPTKKRKVEAAKPSATPDKPHEPPPDKSNEPTPRCPICRRQLSLWKSLPPHLMKIHDVERSEANEMYRTAKNTPNKLPVDCSVCGKTLFNYYKCKAHIVNVHQLSVEKAEKLIKDDGHESEKHVCPKCNVVMMSAVNIRRHLRYTHTMKLSEVMDLVSSRGKKKHPKKEEPARVSSKPSSKSSASAEIPTCPICKKVFQTMMGKNSHISQVHGTSSTPGSSDQESSDHGPLPSLPDVTTCGKCNSSYLNKNNLKRHVVTSHKASEEEARSLMLKWATGKKSSGKKADIKVDKKPEIATDTDVGDSSGSLQVTYLCHICKWSYGSGAQFKRHLVKTHRLTKHKAQEYTNKNRKAAALRMGATKKSKEDSSKKLSQPLASADKLVCIKCHTQWNNIGKLKRHLTNVHKQDAKTADILCQRAKKNKMLAQSRAASKVEKAEDKMLIQLPRIKSPTAAKAESKTTPKVSTPRTTFSSRSAAAVIDLSDESDSRSTKSNGDLGWGSIFVSETSTSKTPKRKGEDHNISNKSIKLEKRDAPSSSKNKVPGVDLNNVVCPVCKKKFLKVKILEVHYRRQHNESKMPHVCTVCRKGYFQEESLQMHFVCYHEGEEGLSPGVDSNDEFSDEEASPPAPQRSSDIVYQCIYCPRSYNKKDAFFNHMKREHGQSTPKSSRYESPKKSPARSTPQQPVQGPSSIVLCPECDRYFRSLADFEAHKEKEHGPFTHVKPPPPAPRQDPPTPPPIESPVVEDVVDDIYDSNTCFLCDHKCQTVLGIKYHVESSHGKDKLPYKCKLCYKYFLTFSSARRHADLEHGRTSEIIKRPAPANPEHGRSSVMMKKSAQVANIRMKKDIVGSYLNRSKNGKGCPKCDKTYYNFKALEEHFEKNHPTFYMPYPCNYCEMSYFQSSKLDNHLLSSHPKESQLSPTKTLPSPEPPSPGKRKPTPSSRKDNKSQKAKAYIGPREGVVACTHCGDLYQSINSMQRHMKNKHPELKLPFQCHICSSDYIDEPRFISHMKISHGYDYVNSEPDVVDDDLNGSSSIQEAAAYVGSPSGRVPCTYCGAIYSSIQVMQKHMGQKHPELLLPFRCELCPQAYIDEDRFQKHMQLDHPAKDVKPKIKKDVKTPKKKKVPTATLR